MIKRFQDIAYSSEENFWSRRFDLLPPKGRPPLPGGRDGLSRSFVQVAAHCSVKLHPWRVGANRTTVNWSRRAKRLAHGIPWGQCLRVWIRSPAGHLLTVRRRIDWFDAHHCRTRRNVHVWNEKLEQRPEKSDCFCELLRWSVSCH